MGRIGKLLSFLRVNKKDAKASDVKINQSGGNNVTCEHFEDSGSDSFPLKTDYPVIMDIDRTGGSVVVGYLDPLTEKRALEGDKRIYGRKPDGTLMNEVWLKNDGTILIDNDNASQTINPMGTYTFQNGSVTVTFDISGTISLVNQSGSIVLSSNGTVTTSNPSINFTISQSGEVDIKNQVGWFTMQSNGEFNINGARITATGDIITAAGVSLDKHYHTQGNDSGSNSQVPTNPPTPTE